MEKISRDQLRVIHARLMAIKSFEEKAQELEKDRLLAKQQAGAAFQKMNSPLHIPLMKHITWTVGSEDASLPDKLLCVYH